MNKWVMHTVLLGVLAAACTSPEPASITVPVTAAAAITTATAAPPASVVQTSPATTTTTTTTTTTVPPLPELQGLGLELVGNDFHRPNLVTAPPGDDRLFVMEQYGYVVILDPIDGRVETPFLDLRDVVKAVSIEQGLLGLAFHPDYAENGRFFV